MKSTDLRKEKSRAEIATANNYFLFASFRLTVLIRSAFPTRFNPVQLGLSQVRLNPAKIVAELDHENNEVTCQLTYDGRSAWATSCRFSKSRFFRFLQDVSVLYRTYVKYQVLLKRVCLVSEFTSAFFDFAMRWR